MAQYHPDVAALSWLIGAWAGSGHIDEPGSTAPRTLRQELTISHDGRPFLLHHSRTWLVDEDGVEGEPAATEVGFWRPLPNNEAELLLADPEGHLQMWAGKVEVTGLVNAAITGARVELSTDVVFSAPGAARIDRGSRMYGLIEGRLAWVYDIQPEGGSMQSVLWAQLVRQS